MRGTPEGFSDFRLAPGSRSAGEILAHICDVLDWGFVMAKDKHVWNESKPQAWDLDVARFLAVLAAFDAFLASDAPLQAPLDKLFQGPVADTLTHIGQIAMMRRLAEAPVKPENFFRAEVVMGRIA